MSKISITERYDAFCKSAIELLDFAGLKETNDEPQIVGFAFLNACTALAKLHFPEDREYHGTGPRSILTGMERAVSSGRKEVPNPDPVMGARSISQVLKEIIKHRPPLDVEVKTSSPTGGNEAARNCPFWEKARNYRTMDDAVFVLMPFGESWSDRLWQDHLRQYLAKAPSGKALVVRRADDMFGQGVMEDIYEGIVTARLVLAECTGKNPNVLYELGLAHSLGKRTVLLSQSEEDIPFDFRRFRFCIYEDNSGGYPKVKSFLQETLRETFGESSR